MIWRKCVLYFLKLFVVCCLHVVESLDFWVSKPLGRKVPSGVGGDAKRIQLYIYHHHEQSWQIMKNKHNLNSTLNLFIININLRELVTSTTVILAPGACGQGVRKRSQVITHFRGIRGIRLIRRRIPGGSIRCTGTTLLACSLVMDLQFLMIFQGRPREEAQGSPRRPNPKGTKKSPKRKLIDINEY